MNIPINPPIRRVNPIITVTPFIFQISKPGSSGSDGLLTGHDDSQSAHAHLYSF